VRGPNATISCRRSDLPRKLPATADTGFQNFLARFPSQEVQIRKSKFAETQIVSILKQADAGMPVKDLCRQAGISVATYYQWKSKFGGMEASELKRVRELEEENSRLKRLYADLALENSAMKDLIAKKL
jgi:putative transposase